MSFAGQSVGSEFRSGAARSVACVCASALLLALGSPAIGHFADPLTHGADEVASAKVESGYKLSRGPYRVSVARATVHDEARDKDLEVVIRSPRVEKAPVKGEDAKAFPMVVFSHGMGGSGETFSELAEHWASHGYVVVLPTHADSLKFRSREERRDFVRSPREATRTVDLAQRVGDVKFLLDSIGSIEKEAGLTGKATIDREQLFVAGHSAGAFTAQLAIGMKARGQQVVGERGLSLTSIGDARLKGAIIISGQGVLGGALTKESWESIDRPILTITGSLDTSPASNQTPESRQDSFTYSRGRAKGGPAAYLLFIEGATHSSYAGKSASRLLGEKATTPSKVITDAVASGTLALLDMVSKDDEAAKTFLESDAIEGISKEAVRWEWK